MQSDNVEKTAVRPGCLWLIVLILAVYQIASVGHGLLNGDVYDTYIQIPLHLKIFFDGAWGLLLSLGAVWMWWKPETGTATARWLIFGTVVYHLMYRALFAQADYERGRVPLIVILFVLILIVQLRWWFAHRRERTQT